jgi:hypothetical protein
MANGKRRKELAKKFKSLFRSEDWLHTPHTQNANTIVTVQETVAIAISPLASPFIHHISFLTESSRICSPLNSPVALTMESATLGHACSNQNITADQRRTEERYKTAVALLKDGLDSRPSSWNSIGQFDDFFNSQDTSKLQRAVEKKLDSRRSSNDSSIWKKGRELFERVFIVMFPLARNLLTIANQGQAVL